MSKENQPEKNTHVIDGEVVNADIDEKIQRGREYSKQKANHNEQDSVSFVDDDSTTDDPDSILKDVDPDKTLVDEMPKESFMKRYSKLVVSVMVVGLILAVIWYSRPSLDWHVEKINDLQKQVNYLQQQNQLVQEQLQEEKAMQADIIAAQVDEILKEQQAQSLLSDEKLAALKAELDSQLQSLQSQLSQASENAGEELSSALTDLNEKAQSMLPQADEKLQSLEQSFESKLGELSQGISELFAFKQQQESFNSEEQASLSTSALNSLQIQQWIIEINTQWMLRGNVEETRKQLFALEQAVNLSDFEYSNPLARLIGQDLNYLEQWLADSQQQVALDTQRLSAAIAKLELSQITENSEASAAENTTNESSTESASDSLMAKFSQLISVKKREDGAALSDVNKLLLNDVLKQRLALLVDRLNWSLSTRSSSLLEQAVSDFEGFIKTYYPANETEFSELLAPFKEIRFVDKQPLSITRLDENISE